MPSYLSSAKDSFVPTALYKPDFEAIGNIWATKQAQYNQGLSQLNSIYSSIYNAPVTNDANNARKEQYIKNANESFKNLSTMDLSNQRVVAGAKSVFQPFEDDVNLQKDMVATQKLQQDFSHADQLRNSSKAEDRALYWDGGVELLQISAEKLKNGNPDDDSIYNTHRWVNGYNSQQRLAKGAVDQKLNIKTVDGINGPVKMLYQNGRFSTQAYNNWAKNFLQSDPEFHAYANARGLVAANQQMKAIQRNTFLTTGQQLSDQQAMSIVGKGIYDKSYKLVTDTISKTKASVESLKSKLEGLRSNDVGSPDKYQEAQALAMQIKQGESDLSREQNSLEDLNSDVTKQMFVSNFEAAAPEYFAKMLLNTEASNFANTYADTHSTQDFEANPAYYKGEQLKFDKEKYQYEIYKDKADLDIKKDQLKLDQDKFEWEKHHGNLKGSKSGSNGVSGDDLTNQGDYVGKDTHNLQTVDTHNIFKQNQASTLNAAYSQIGTALGTLLSGSPIQVGNYSTSDIRFQTNLQSQIKNLVNSDTPNQVLAQSPELRAMVKYNKDKFGITGSSKSDILKGIDMFSNERLNSVKDSSQYATMKSAREDIIDADKNINRTLATQADYNDKVSKYLEKNGATGNPFSPVAKLTNTADVAYRSKDGKLKLIDSDYIAKELPSVTLADGTRLNSKELAEAYVTGNLRTDVKINYDPGSSAFGGYQSSSPTVGSMTLTIGNRTTTIDPNSDIAKSLKSIEGKYGTSANFNAKQKSVVANVFSENPNLVGMTPVFTYAVGKTETSKDNAANKILGGIQGSDDAVVRVTDEDGEDITSTNWKQALASIDASDLTDNGVIVRTDENGYKTVSFNLNATGKKNLGKDAARLFDGKHQFHIAPYSDADFTKYFSKTNPVNYNPQLLHGIDSTPAEEADGLEYHIVSADGKGSESQNVNVQYRYKVYDKEGNQKWSNYTTASFSLQDKPLNEIETWLSQMRRDNSTTLVQSQQYFNTKGKESGTPSMNEYIDNLLKDN